MTRKAYIHKVWGVIAAIYKVWPPEEGGRVGAALRHAADHAKEVPELFGSYEKAWNCTAMEDLRRMLRERGAEI